MERFFKKVRFAERSKETLLFLSRLYVAQSVVLYLFSSLCYMLYPAYIAVTANGRLSKEVIYELSGFCSECGLIALKGMCYRIGSRLS